MPLVTLIAHRNTPGKEKTKKLIEFFAAAGSIAKKHQLKANYYNFIISTNVGECSIVNLDYTQKTVEFVFAPHSIYEGHDRERITLEMEKFIRFAHELAHATGYDIVIQKPLYYDQDR